eukprot:jgi/Galph1/5822/GphlegSOOS_G4528.1
MPNRLYELYDILGVSVDCDQTEIKKAYLRCAKQCHPDRNPDVDPDLFKRVSHAYEILSDPEKRARYDKYGEEGVNGNFWSEESTSQPPSAEDLFGAFFGASFTDSDYFDTGYSHNRFRATKGDDIRYVLSVTLESLYSGKVVTLSMQRTVLVDKNQKGRKCLECGGKGFVVTSRYIGFGISQVSVFFQVSVAFHAKRLSIFEKKMKSPCLHCHGCGLLFHTKKERKTIQVNIEPGMKDNEELKFPEMADEINPYTKPGDLVVVLQQEQHPFFRRVGDDLYIEQSISLSEAIGGFEIPIKTLDNRILLIRNEEGTIIRPGMKKRIRGEGMPKRGNSKGSLYIQFTVVFPLDHSLSAEACARLRVLLPGIPGRRQVNINPDQQVEVIVCKESVVESDSNAQANNSYSNRKQPTVETTSSSLCSLQ